VKKLLVCLVVALPLVAHASELTGPRKLSLAHCQAKKGGSFDMQISRVMVPKALCQTTLTIGNRVFTSACEYSPQGMYYIHTDAQGSNRKVIFATWGVIKAAGGEIDLQPDQSNEETFVCSIVAAQG